MVGWFVADISLGVGVVLAFFVIGIELFSRVRSGRGLAEKLTTETHFVTVSAARLENREASKSVRGKDRSSG